MKKVFRDDASNNVRTGVATVWIIADAYNAIKKAVEQGKLDVTYDGKPG